MVLIHHCLGAGCLILNGILLCSEGGFFNAIMTFPENYPNSPPKVRFTSEIWHPNGGLIRWLSRLVFIMDDNYLPFTIWIDGWLVEITVYSDGRVCISILHPPGDDPNGYELASERWSPVHTVSSRWKDTMPILVGRLDGLHIWIYDISLLVWHFVGEDVCFVMLHCNAIIFPCLVESRWGGGKKGCDARTHP